VIHDQHYVLSAGGGEESEEPQQEEEASFAHDFHLQARAN
jgi:hypothetical protein